MLPDLLSAVLRGLGFVAILQAGGAALFLVGFSREAAARRSVCRLIRVAAVAGSVLLLAQYLLEPARMAGAFAGIWDRDLQLFALHTRTALALALRLAGLLLLLAALRNDDIRLPGVAVAGAIVIAGSFAATGHTSQNPERWLLGPLLVLHLLVVEFWFGSLLPLRLVTMHDPAAAAARIVSRFSKLAAWTVPLILVAGTVIAAWLLPDVAALRRPYGLGLLLKVLAFVLLMGLAAHNKWRLGPALERGGTAAAARLRRSIDMEFLLIAAVLLGTAALTMFWSPEH
ncbi:MAG TPA: CopD family protein [Steroidobacteraceae bacterium]|nr:CopD family protein [Steroidobacteraceae bacterium]